MYLDVAHNAPAISNILTELLLRQRPNASVMMIFGAAQGKKVDEIMQTMRDINGNEQRIAGVYLV